MISFFKSSGIGSGSKPAMVNYRVKKKRRRCDGESQITGHEILLDEPEWTTEDTGSELTVIGRDSSPTYYGTMITDLSNNPLSYPSSTTPFVLLSINSGANRFFTGAFLRWDITSIRNREGPFLINTTINTATCQKPGTYLACFQCHCYYTGSMLLSSNFIVNSSEYGPTLRHQQSIADVTTSENHTMYTGMAILTLANSDVLEWELANTSGAQWIGDTTPARGSRMILIKIS